MEYIDSWIFNRGQTITLYRGPKTWQASVLLRDTPGYPYKYLRGKDRDRLLLRALALVKKDVGGEVVWLDDEPRYDTAFPIEVRTESAQLREFIASPEIQDIMHSIQTDIQLDTLERVSWRDEDTC